ncbi:hypothetical protein FPV67DRAFT_1505619 [Lyophyllum atratum]|nr:hypothetical protein FPV67DRAFT_1505619 [Lyophyllum atratum]
MKLALTFLMATLAHISLALPLSASIQARSPAPDKDILLPGLDTLGSLLDALYGTIQIRDLPKRDGALESLLGLGIPGLENLQLEDLLALLDLREGHGWN